MIDPKNDSIRLRQLPLDLHVDEEQFAQVNGLVESISPEEARKISEQARMAFEALTSLTPNPSPGGRGELKWMEEYRQLREVGWPWRVACYMAWAASPKKNRQPKTQEDLATGLLGLTSDRQIAKWRKDNPVIDETVALLQAAPLFAHRRDVIEALIESASNPDYKGKGDRELLLKLTGDLVDRRDVRGVVAVGSLEDLPTGVLENIVGGGIAGKLDVLDASGEKTDE